MTKEITRADIQSYLADHPQLTEWLKTTSGKTPHFYTWALIKFDQLSPTKVAELLKQSDNSPKSKIQRRTLVFNATRSLTTSRQVQVNSAIRSLLSFYAIDVADNRGTIKRVETKYYDAYTHEQVNKTIGFLDKPLEKLYAIICAESGLRGDVGVLRLRWKHIQNDYNNRTGPIWLELGPDFRQNSKHTGYVFIGNRAREFINELVESNDIHTEPEELLFPFAPSSIFKIIVRAKRKAHVGDNVKPIHGLRKFFYNSLISANIPEPIQDIMFGRFKTQNAKAYTMRKREELLPYYEQAYPFLDYMNNMPIQTQALSTKLTQLQDQNKQLNERLLLTEEKLLNIKKIHTEPDLTLNEWTQKPDEQIFKDLQQLFADIGNVIGKARAAERFEKPQLPEMFRTYKGGGTPLTYDEIAIIEKLRQSRNTTT
jgi:hypothetical protein